MFVGHFAAGFVAKRVAPGASLGTVMLAAILPDLLFCAFLFAGIEHVAIKPGITAVNALDLYDIPISHSLLANVIWAAAFAGIYYGLQRDSRRAWVLFGAVLSHWFLDFVSHRPDMPLAPGLQQYFGLGLWYSAPATFLVEGLIWGVAVFLYARAAPAKKTAGTWIFWAGIILLTALWMISLRGEPPPGLLAVGIANSLLFSLVVAWAYWINRLRPTLPR